MRQKIKAYNILYGAMYAVVNQPYHAGMAEAIAILQQAQTEIRNGN